MKSVRTWWHTPPRWFDWAPPTITWIWRVLLKAGYCRIWWTMVHEMMTMLPCRRSPWSVWWWLVWTVHMNCSRDNRCAASPSQNLFRLGQVRILKPVINHTPSTPPCVPVPIVPYYLLCHKRIEYVPILSRENAVSQKYQDVVLHPVTFRRMQSSVLF